MSEMVENTNNTENTETVVGESYGETDSPEVEAVVQFYERKIGIFENTLDLFKQNLMRVNNRFNALRLAYRPLKESHEILTIENDNLLEINHNLSLELRKKTTTVELSKNKITQLENQNKNYEQTFEKFNSIFNYLELNVVKMLKDIKKNPDEPQWKLISLKDERNLLTSNNSIDDLSNQPLYEQTSKSNGTAVNEQKSETIIVKKYETLEFQVLPTMEYSYITEIESSTNNEMIKSSTPFGSPNVVANELSQQSNDNDNNNINNNMGELVTPNNTSVVSLHSPNIKFCATYNDLMKYEHESGHYVFVPDNDYFRTRSYVYSNEFCWDNTNDKEEDIFVNCPINFKNCNDNNINTTNNEISKSIQITFNNVIYDNVNDIPTTQPIDGFYVAVVENNDNHTITTASTTTSATSVTSTANNTNAVATTNTESKEIIQLTYYDIMQEKDNNIKYKFVPNLQYLYLSGNVALPKSLKNLISSDLSRNDGISEEGNDIWPFRMVYYNNYKCIPTTQPIDGFYIFLRKKDYSNHNIDSTTKSRNRKTSQVSSSNKNKKQHKYSTLKDIATSFDTEFYNENKQFILDKSIDTLLGLTNNTNKDDVLLSVVQELTEYDRDKFVSSISCKNPPAIIDDTDRTTLNPPSLMRKKKPRQRVSRNKSLFNPHIQFDLIKTIPATIKTPKEDQETVETETTADIDNNTNNNKPEVKNENSRQAKKLRNAALRKGRKSR